MRNFHANKNRASGLRYEHAGTSLPHLPRLLSAAAACKCKMDFLKIISVQFLTAWSVRLHNGCDCVSQNRKRQLWRATTAWPDITGTEASHYFCLQSIPIILIIRRSDEENGAPVPLKTTIIPQSTELLCEETVEDLNTQWMKIALFSIECTERRVSSEFF